MVVSGEQITMRSTWVSNRGESPPQTKVTLKQLFDPPSRGGVQPVRPASGRRLGPQVAVSEGGRAGRQKRQRPEAGTPGGGVRGGRAGRQKRQRPEAGTPGGGEEEEEKEEEEEEARKKKQNLHTG